MACVRLLWSQCRPTSLVALNSLGSPSPLTPCILTPDSPGTGSKKELKNKKTDYVESSKTKAVPLMKLIKELFHPMDEDNQDSTEILEKIAGVGITALIDDLEDEKKAT